MLHIYMHSIDMTYLLHYIFIYYMYLREIQQIKNCSRRSNKLAWHSLSAPGSHYKGWITLIYNI